VKWRFSSIAGSFFFDLSFWSLRIDEALREYPVKKSRRLSSRL
jgi:hypothetical protein